MRLVVEAYGTEQAARLLTRLARRADGRMALLGLLDTIMETQRERYAGDVRWKRVAASTRETDRRMGRDPRPMIDTGALMDSLTRRGAAGQVVKVRSGALFFGTDLFYARFHDRGEGVPRRPPVGFTREQRRKVIDELRDLLLED